MQEPTNDELREWDRTHYWHSFTPMADGPLRTSLMRLAERDGVPVRDVLVADASRRTTALNAYVSGLGPTRRIVVYDTLLREAPPEQVEAVVAHELGHAKRNDVLTGTLIGALGAAAGVCALYLIGSWGGLLRRAGVDSIVDPRALALVTALFAIAGAALAWRKVYPIAAALLVSAMTIVGLVISIVFGIIIAIHGF